MGLLNHLFGSKKGIAKELVMDDKKRMALWNEHLTNYALREKLSKHFNFGNVDKALQDFETTEKVLRQIETLISPELVNIANEEKTDEEILVDLERLKSNSEIEKLSDVVVSVKQKQSALLKLFHGILNVLKVELHLIRLIRKKPSNSRDLLLRLFEIIFHQEARLYKVFREQYFFEENKHIHGNIVRIARAIILEEEVKEEMETDEEKFVREMVKQMIPDESRRRYRKLGEDIFFILAEMAGAPMPRGEDITEGIKRMEGFMKNDEIMYKIVKKFRPKYDNPKIRGVILAFRKAYNLGHFEELESEFAT
ncbi:MAG: hypothetical protein KJ583_04300 [Nanoarchaeota archaeon]|nr:hypothetical protein [Nanoarchaeota archaeon]MBU1269466.1 hypothetical protein [Nanoarchaeota archaeon]MBU1604514.1 hypothetical protein [Nanoarchaeota archaeon]MBU2443463.1 hypothetical protein [Nanoarchaeota archaeon]